MVLGSVNCPAEVRLSTQQFLLFETATFLKGWGLLTPHTSLSFVHGYVPCLQKYSRFVYSGVPIDGCVKMKFDPTLSHNSLNVS